MNEASLYDSYYQQEDGNDMLIELLEADVLIDQSTDIKTKGIFP